MTFARSTPIRWFGALTLVAGCAAGARDAPDYSGIPAWSSRAIPEAQGSFKALGDGKREALRYKGWTTRDFGEFRTYAYADPRPEPPVRRVAMPSGVKPPIPQNRIRQAPPDELRRLTVDGVFGGSYQRPEEEILEVWRTGVAEVRDLIQNGLSPSA